MTLDLRCDRCRSADTTLVPATRNAWPSRGIGVMTVTRSILLFVLAAYWGALVAGSLIWGTALDGFHPDRWDITGALICLMGVAVIMYAPRGA